MLNTVSVESVQNQGVGGANGVTPAIYLQIRSTETDILSVYEVK